MPLASSCICRGEHLLYVFLALTVIFSLYSLQVRGLIEHFWICFFDWLGGLVLSEINKVSWGLFRLLLRLRLLLGLVVRDDMILAGFLALENGGHGNYLLCLLLRGITIAIKQRSEVCPQSWKNAADESELTC